MREARQKWERVDSDPHGCLDGSTGSQFSVEIAQDLLFVRLCKGSGFG